MLMKQSVNKPTQFAGTINNRTSHPTTSVLIEILQSQPKRKMVVTHDRQEC